MEEIVYFDENSSTKKFSYYSRQLISREIDLEKVRRAEAYFTEKVRNFYLFDPRSPSMETYIFRRPQVLESKYIGAWVVLGLDSLVGVCHVVTWYTFENLENVKGSLHVHLLEEMVCL